MIIFLQLNFDLLAKQYLDITDKKVNNENLARARIYFENNIDKILDAITGVDEARKGRDDSIIWEKAKYKRK